MCRRSPFDQIHAQLSHYINRIQSLSELCQERYRKCAGTDAAFIDLIVSDPANNVSGDGDRVTWLAPPISSWLISRPSLADRKTCVIFIWSLLVSSGFFLLPLRGAARPSSGGYGASLFEEHRINNAGQCRADNRGNPKEPELLQRPPVHEERRAVLRAGFTERLSTGMPIR